ncbi:MAG: 2Fe-2S iron-sulfur cluster binding domain-containing protein [Proteobacteria bacterium]|nr:2Fe-2S iron-sulfur cluster binding domain-containing protein [Pseudomonadota bacterium]
MADRQDRQDLVYETHVFCCVNVREDGHPRGCCSARGSVELREYMKARAKELGLAKIRINTSGCLERCELGPTMVIYPEAVWYGYSSRADIDEILERHIIGGERVERLILETDQLVPKPKAKRELKLIIASVDELTPEIKRIELVPRDGGELPAFEAGAHIDLVTGDGLKRSYSLANDPIERHRYVLGILREKNGRGGSAWLHESAGAGDTITAMAPINNFGLAEDAGEHILIAGGIGIAPILSMGYRLRQGGANFALHYCTRDARNTAFADEVEEVFGPNLTFHHDGGDPARGIKLDDVLSKRADGAHLYVCGPAGLMAAARQATGHWPEGTVHFELFAPSARPKAWKNESFEVYLSRHKQALTVAADKTILEAVREAGIDAESSCEDGLCATCRTRLLGGKAEHRDDVLSDREKAGNKSMMICISRALPGETLILDI